jgi:GNAT superfamily N-acetyltransferase
MPIDSRVAAIDLWVGDLELRHLRPEELVVAAGVLTRGMDDNPIHVACFGADGRHRSHALGRFFRAFLPAMAHPPLAVCRRGWPVAVLGMAPPGTCRPSPAGMARMLVRSPPASPGEAWRATQWAGAWSRRDPSEPHWHVGPLAVDAPLRGVGLGSRLMQAFCDRMDQEGAVAYLETDRPENVGFYGRFAFEIVDSAVVLGTRNWFMRRRPGRAAAHDRDGLGRRI